MLFVILKCVDSQSITFVRSFFLSLSLRVCVRERLLSSQITTAVRGRCVSPNIQLSRTSPSHSVLSPSIAPCLSSSHKIPSLKRMLNSFVWSPDIVSWNTGNKHIHLLNNVLLPSTDYWNRNAHSCQVWVGIEQINKQTSTDACCLHSLPLIPDCHLFFLLIHLIFLLLSFSSYLFLFHYFFFYFSSLSSPFSSTSSYLQSSILNPSFTQRSKDASVK